MANNDGRLFLEIKNDDASPQTVTIKTAYTQNGFTLSDDVISLLAGATQIAGPFETQTFNNDDLTVDVDASDADIKYRAYKL